MTVITSRDALNVGDLVVQLRNVILTSKFVRNAAKLVNPTESLKTIFENV